jgi:hypothetical protein
MAVFMYVIVGAFIGPYGGGIYQFVKNLRITRMGEDDRTGHAVSDQKLG